MKKSLIRNNKIQQRILSDRR